MRDLSNSVMSARTLNRSRNYLMNWGMSRVCMGDCFFFNDAATTEIYTLSLHDGASDLHDRPRAGGWCRLRPTDPPAWRATPVEDRKSTRLNSSHSQISYAVFCLKKK